MLDEAAIEEAKKGCDASHVDETFGTRLQDPSIISQVCEDRRP
jgi:hypothetical protein